MAARPKKRQKMDPSPVKPDTKTLFHFFSKPTSNGSVAVTEASPPKTESDSGSINDEPRWKRDIGLCTPAPDVIKNEMTLPRIPMDEVKVPADEMQFDASFTEANDSCSPTKEERDEIESMENFDFRDDEYRDEDFRDDELDGFPYEDIDDIEDDIEIKEEPIESVADATVDEGPSCPFCSFSFKGLSENVKSTFELGVTIVDNTACKPMYRQHPSESTTKVNTLDCPSPSTSASRNDTYILCLLQDNGQQYGR